MGKWVKGYKFWDSMANKVVISRDVVFDKNSMLKSTQGKEQQVPESSIYDKQMVQVELETPVQEKFSFSYTAYGHVRLGLFAWAFAWGSFYIEL
jgi:hypothetical protein